MNAVLAQPSVMFSSALCSLALFSTALFSMPLLSGCGPAASISEEQARAVLEPALTQATPAGRTGLLLEGKAVWLVAPMFDKSCLESKNLAFNDDPGSRPSGTGARISPTYLNQRYLLASTDRGYCVLLGEGLKATIKEATFDWAIQDRWRFQVEYTMDQPTDWFSCLADTTRIREIMVVQGAGEGAAPTIEGDVMLAEGDCPHPLAGGETRGKGTRPTAKPKKAPSKDDVAAAAKTFDDALWEGDFEAALAAVSCYNLFEDDKVGSCSVGEVIAHGPNPRGEQRMRDGTPWLEYVADDVAQGMSNGARIVADRKDKTLYHVVLKHKRTGKARSFSVQWTDGQWKLVAIVGRKAESLTTARILNDLHDRELRDIFERRLAGEQIDDQGNSLVPEVEDEGGGGEVQF